MPERAVLALVGWLGCALVTGKPILARQMATEFWQDNFKDALRRAYWYASRGWPGLGSRTSDPFFCFSDGLDLRETEVLLDWVVGRDAALPALEAASARVVSLAQIVHQSARQQHNQKALQALEDFHDVVDQLLARLNEIRANAREAEPASTGANSQKKEREGDFARDDAEQALKDVARLLPLKDWGWTALSGTFLGIYREGDFLPHDFDIDLGLRANTTDVEQLKQILHAAPEFDSVRMDTQYQLTRNSDGLHITTLPVLVKAVHRTGIAVDFSLLHEDNSVWWHGSMMHRWDHSPMDLVEYKLRGVTILGPRDGDRYLTEGYGDWRTPVKEFNCSSGRRNLVVAPNLLSLSLGMKRLIWHLQQGDPRGYDQVLSDVRRQNIVQPESAGQPPAINRNWLQSRESQP